MLSTDYYLSWKKPLAISHVIIMVLIGLFILKPGYGWASGADSLKDNSLKDNNLKDNNLQGNTPKDKEKQTDSTISLKVKEKEVDVSLKKEAQHSIDMALGWLKQKQNKDGSWSNPDYPALTSLAVLGFLQILPLSVKIRLIHPLF